MLDPAIVDTDSRTCTGAPIASATGINQWPSYDMPVFNYPAGVSDPA